MTLDHYCRLFSSLTRAPGPMWDATTRNRAPHKPLLLLAVMDLVARGVIASRFISITGELTRGKGIRSAHCCHFCPNVIACSRFRTKLLPTGVSGFGASPFSS